MTYDGGFIMQKGVDWSLLRSSSARLLPKGRKNDGMTIPVSACAMLHVWDEKRNKNLEQTLSKYMI